MGTSAGSNPSGKVVELGVGQFPVFSTLEARQRGRVHPGEWWDPDVRFLSEVSCPPSDKASTSPALRAGLEYEAKFHSYMRSVFGGSFEDFRGRRLRYRRGVKVSVCQPDGVLRLGELLVVFEVKRISCTEAHQKLYNLYGPLVSQRYNCASPLLVEVCSKVDPGCSLPNQTVFIRSLEEFKEFLLDPHATSETLGLWIWN